MSGRNPPSYCTLTLIAMQGHQQKGRQTNTSSNNKDKSNTIIETSASEDHDDENLIIQVHDPVIHLEVDEVWSLDGHDFRPRNRHVVCRRRNAPEYLARIISSI